MSEIKKPDIRVEIIQANSNAAGLFSYVIKMVEYLRANADKPILTTFNIEYWRAVQQEINLSPFAPSSEEFKQLTNKYLEDLLFNKTGNSFTEEEKRGNGVLEAIFGGLMTFMREMQDASENVNRVKFSQSKAAVIDAAEDARAAVQENVPNPFDGVPPADVPDRTLTSLDNLANTNQESEGEGNLRKSIMEDELISLIQAAAGHLAIAQLSRLTLESMNDAFRADKVGQRAFDAMLSANKTSVSDARDSLLQLEEVATSLHEICEIDGTDPEDLEIQTDFIDNLHRAQRLLPRLYSVEETSSPVFARVWNSLVADAEKNILAKSHEEVMEHHPECENPECLIKALGDVTVIPLYRRHVDQSAASDPASNNLWASTMSVIDHVLLDVHNGALVMNLLVTFPAMDEAMQALVDAAVEKRNKDLPEVMMGFLSDWKDRADESITERVMHRLNNLTTEQGRMKSHRSEQRKLKQIEEELAANGDDKQVHAVMLHGAVQIMQAQLSVVENFMLQADVDLGAIDANELTPEMFSE